MEKVKFNWYEIEELAGDGWWGVCTKCGAYIEGIEPDAEKDACECCGQNGVYGVEQLLMARYFGCK